MQPFDTVHFKPYANRKWRKKFQLRDIFSDKM